MLKINLANGAVKTYKDVPYRTTEPSTTNVAAYSIVKYFPSIRYCLISVAYYEGGTYILLNTRNGETIDVQGDAILSPDGQRLVIWNVDIEAQYSPNLLLVYRVIPDGLALEFAKKSKDWGPENVSWKNNRLIRFTKRFWVNNAIQTKAQTLRFVGSDPSLGGKWRIE